MKKSKMPKALRKSSMPPMIKAKIVRKKAAKKSK